MLSTCVVLIAEGNSSVAFVMVFVMSHNQRQKQQSEVCVKSRVSIVRSPSPLQRFCENEKKNGQSEASQSVNVLARVSVCVRVLILVLMLVLQVVQTQTDA